MSNWVPLAILLTAMLIVPVFYEMGFISRFGWMVREYPKVEPGYAPVLLVQPATTARLYVQYSPRIFFNGAAVNPYASIIPVGGSSCADSPSCTSIVITAQPKVLYLDEDLNVTVIFSISVPRGVQGFYWLSLSWICSLQAVTVGFRGWEVNASDFPGLGGVGGARLCPNSVFDYHAMILAYSGMDVLSVKLG